MAKLNKGDKDAQKFRSSIRHLEYIKKWFSKLRSVLYMEGQSQDLDSLLAPLSKRYHLSKDEALSIPQKLADYTEELENELSSLNPQPESGLPQPAGRRLA